MMKFLNTDIELCPVLTGYFAKLVTSLASNRAENLLPYLYEHDEVMTWFAKHTYSKSITDVLSIILKNEDDYPDVSPEVITSKRNQIIEILLSNLHTKDETKIEDFALNMVDIFQNLVRSKGWFDLFLEDNVIETLVKLSKEAHEHQSTAANRILSIFVQNIKMHL